LVHAFCGTPKVTWNGDGHRTSNPTGIVASFSEIFQDEIAAQAETDQKQFAIPSCGLGCLKDSPQVLGGTAVIGSGEAVRFA
jgi:hypothetical protein